MKSRYYHVCQSIKKTIDLSQKDYYVSGFEQLDQHGFRLSIPGFMPVVATYGCRRRVFLRQLACNLHLIYGLKTLITAFDDLSEARHRGSLFTYLSNVSEAEVTPECVRKYRQIINEAFVFLRRDGMQKITVDAFIDKIEKAVDEHGVKVIILEPFSALHLDAPRIRYRHDYLENLFLRFKGLAYRRKLLFIVTKHPDRAFMGLWDIASLLTSNTSLDTACVKDKADIAIAMSRTQPVPGPVYLNINQINDPQNCGRPTLAKMILNAPKSRFAAADIGCHLRKEIAESCILEPEIKQ